MICVKVFAVSRSPTYRIKRHPPLLSTFQTCGKLDVFGYFFNTESDCLCCSALAASIEPRASGLLYFQVIKSLLHTGISVLFCCGAATSH